ncbi:DinB family protein [Sphingobacterium sp. UBA6645]|uniref:DinB family protein n=1 Tax=Sphingobacterium sp. UBA6645 TaxID=1947511 RepID=UPI0025FB8265|nr:DinB family protein [Sphingobacterium sp. UBA6645]
MKDFFKELLEYSSYYNRQLIDVINQDPSQVSEKTTSLMSHMLNAHYIWNYRIAGEKPLFAVWQNQPKEVMLEIELTNFKSSEDILENYALDHIGIYTNSQGQQFERNVRDILFHIINHTTYHRAQIASDFKVIGLTPLLNAYIHYKR